MMYRLMGMALGMALLLSACGDSAAEARRQKEELEKTQKHKVAQIAWRDLSYQDTVVVDSEYTWNYVFYNTGWKPVKIKQALSTTPDCSCTVPAASVPIGEQDTVKVHCKFPDEGRHGIEINVEHDTPQKDFMLILIATAVKSR